MTTKSKIDTLWQEFRDAINKSYKEAAYGTDGTLLRDYAEDISWNDSLAALLGRESANERQHRHNRPSPAGFSIDSASKLILMNSVIRGAIDLKEMPKATLFLEFRQTAAEAVVIGFLVKANIKREWVDRVVELDYAKLMN